MKTSTRYSIESLAKNTTDDKGRLFANDYGFTDLTPVEIVGASVDTVRQLFLGVPKPEIIHFLKLLKSENEEKLPND